MDLLQFLTDFFSSYGYIAVFVVLLICGFGVPIPEDITLVSGGIISGLGFTNPHVMFLVGMLGVLCGDGLIFTLGKVYGDKVLKVRWIARYLTKARFEQVQEKFERYGNWVLFVARFLPGLRTPIFLSAGMSQRVSFWRFLFMDGFAALISVPIWVYLGYFGANNREWLLMWIQRGQTGIFIALGVLFLGLGIVWYRWKKKKQAAQH